MLTERKKAEFNERGFTRVTGAIPQAQLSRMVERFWRTMRDVHNVKRGDRKTWFEGIVRGIGDLNKEPEFRPFRCETIESAIDSLLGHGSWHPPSSWGQILATFPAEQWTWNSLFQGQVEVDKVNWHTDFPYTTPPGELCGVQVFGLIADLGPGGGGTLIVENSHRVVSDFVMRQPVEVLQKMKRARKTLLRSHPWFQTVSSAVSMPRGETWIDDQRSVIASIPVSVRELTGSAGDVYFTHPWLLHAPSPNGNSTPRLMCTQRINCIA